MYEEITKEGVWPKSEAREHRFLVQHNINLDEVRGGFSKFNRDAFFSCACISNRKNSSAFCRIRSKKSNKLVGWFIPSLYYSEPEQFSDTRFLGDFAYAAFLHFWDLPEYKQVRDLHFVRPPLADGGIRFCDILPEELGFIVLSKECFKKEKIQISELKMSMLRNGIWPYGNEMHYSLFFDSATAAISGVQEEQAKNLGIYPLSNSCKPVANLLSSILSMAHREFSGVGGFLYLYQFSEYLMEVNFSSAVTEISGKSLPAWKLKKKLSEVTSESYRLRSVARQARENGATMAIFDALGDECRLFLRACGVEQEDENKMWIDWVYAVRNLLVHNHLSVLRSGVSAKLERINILLHRATLELVFHY